jgi:hypothetical protein
MIFSIVKMCGFYYGVIMSSMSYYCIDGFAITTLSYTMTLSEPVELLSKKRPTASLLGPVTMASSLGFNFIAVLCMIFSLILMGSDSEYIKWPAENAETADWWTLSDNWETTVMYNVFFPFLLAAASIYSFGYQFRKPMVSNIYLVANVVIPFVITSAVLLMEPNTVTHWWHTASYDFNEPGTGSPVWEAYQEAGGRTSSGMSFSLRLRLWFLVTGFIGLAALWQRFVMEGFIGDYIKRNFKPNKVLLKLKY